MQGYHFTRLSGYICLVSFHKYLVEGTLKWLRFASVLSCATADHSCTPTLCHLTCSWLELFAHLISQGGALWSPGYVLVVQIQHKHVPWYIFSTGQQSHNFIHIILHEQSKQQPFDWTIISTWCTYTIYNCWFLNSSRGFTPCASFCLDNFASPWTL